MVVLGAEAARVRAEADLAGCTAVENPGWAGGMGGSFRAGIEAAPAGHAVLVALVDHRALTARWWRGCCGRRSPAGLPPPDSRTTPAACAGGTRSCSARDQARAAAALAGGDAGARTWLARNPEAVDLVDCSDLSDGGDVDTAADLWRRPAARPGPGNRTSTGSRGPRPAG